jgi:hypothetical protein
VTAHLRPWTAPVICFFIAACLPRERINSACVWSNHVMPPSAGGRALRAHLIEDVRVAKDLGIRYADASGPPRPTPEGQRARDLCTGRSFAEIARAHHLSVPEVTAMRTARELWIDVLAVFLPTATLFAIVSLFLVSKIIGRHGPDERGGAAAVLTVLAPLAAGVAVALTQIWGVMVEQLRLGNGHISYRAFELPATRHGWLLWVLALALFAAISAWELRRTRATAARTRPATG